MELLLDILKWSAIVGAAALALTLLKPLLDRRYSAKWRYGVWLVMAAFCCWPRCGGRRSGTWS